ncbi:hypothetical protein CEXT_454761 [Caerostris extrusa]|uniref:Uncharacterized protein n=1 Tax=Caerostris extrusa TaxID=172846 RepID=A0AAV4Y3F7_CAEEX|nr:hypothetical protein CEXT_454761 [Caerostris extrusa]
MYQQFYAGSAQARNFGKKNSTYHLRSSGINQSAPRTRTTDTRGGTKEVSGGRLESLNDKGTKKGGVGVTDCKNSAIVVYKRSRDICLDKHLNATTHKIVDLVEGFESFRHLH